MSFRLAKALMADMSNAPPVRGFMRTQEGIDRERYRVHKLNAADRGIQFLLTFEAWLDWWKSTGHYHERGSKRGQYVMGRKGDLGAYEIGNIECQLAVENSTAPHIGAKRSAETRLRMSNARRKSLRGER